MKTDFVPRQFWDQKILAWEHNKYFKRRPVLDVNSSLKERKRLAVAILKRKAQQQSVVELGCGSGVILLDLKDVHLKKYLGLDLSPVAIAEAKKRAQALKLPFPVEFQVADVSNIEKDIECDTSFSLGLFDWLSNEEVEALILKVKCQNFFHSFTERRWSLQRLLHRGYVFFMYGYRTRTYVPSSRSKSEVENLFLQKKPVEFISSKKLGIGALVHNYSDLDTL